MANENGITDAGEAAVQPIINTIGPADLLDALAKGLADFNAKPSHLVFIYAFYPVLALIAARLGLGYDILPLLFPLFAGITLVSPLAATGFYEMSRRREQGLDLSWGHVLDIRRSPSMISLVTLGFVLVAIFFVWLGVAQAIYESIFGAATPESIEEFALQIFTTTPGWTLIIVGSGVGLLFAVLVLIISVVSFPMLVDRDVGVMTAVQTSARATLRNPLTMTMWGLVLVVTLSVGALPFFIGLAVVFPVLGHSSWHLYRKVVEY